MRAPIHDYPREREGIDEAKGKMGEHFGQMSRSGLATGGGGHFVKFVKTTFGGVIGVVEGKRPHRDAM